MFRKSATNYFVIKYDIDEATAGAKNVSVYAEINDAPEFPEKGAFMLDCFIAIEPIGFRNYLVGLIFGDKSWSRSEVEDYVDSIIGGLIHNDFAISVKSMLHASAVTEAYPFDPQAH